MIHVSEFGGQVSGSRVYGMGGRVWIRAQGFGVRVCGVRACVCLGYKILGFRVLGFRD